MKRLLLLLLAAMAVTLLHAQQGVGIGTTTPDASAQLDISSTTKGILVPRMTGAQRTAIISPANGLIVFQTNTDVIPGSVPGFYIFEGSGLGGAWKRLARVEELPTSSWTVSGINQYSNVAGNVGIGTSSPGASALLDISSTTKGMLIPRMTSAQRIAIASPATGLMVYETSTSSLWIYNGSSWVQQSSGGVSPWTILNNNIYNTNSGRVGIGITAPDPSAALEISSITTGLLIPRMTSAQRIAIGSPAPGLMVYETTTNSFWFYNSSVWNQIGTGGASPWTISGTNIYNSNTGNVGIGTSLPTSKLHIAGNSLLINGTNPILQFQQAGVNTGYVQVSSDDLRMGTNSGNGSGKMVIRMDGTDRIYIDSIGQMGIGKSIPKEKLDVAGNIRILSDGSFVSQPSLIIYPNPDNAFDAAGPSHISFYNWAPDGNGGNDYTSKYEVRFEGSIYERLKLQHVDHENQLVLIKTGKVGINTQTPSEQLQVNGNVQLQEVSPYLKLKTTNTVAPFTELGIEFNGPTSSLARIQYTNSSLVMSGRSGIFSDLVLKDGNVGIGTGTPSEKLQILGGNMLMTSFNPTIQMQQGAVDKGFIQLNSDDIRIGTNSGNTNGKFIVRTNGSDRVFVDDNGNMGIDVSNPLTKLQILNGADVSISTHGYLMLGSVTGPNVIFDSNEIMARNAGSTTTLVLQNDGGGVRIGNVAVPSGYKFAINGKMICEELKVKLASSGWPDYVFNDDHKLLSLQEVEKFISQNKHLPNIPSAAEVEKNGIEVGDMQKRMMEKIEELTLYIIAQQKQIDELKKTSK